MFRVTNPPMRDPQNTKQSPWTRLKTLVFTVNSEYLCISHCYHNITDIYDKSTYNIHQVLRSFNFYIDSMFCIVYSLLLYDCCTWLMFLLWFVLFRYYALEVTYFKSSLDRKLLELLWNKYWVNTLSSSSLLTVCRQLQKTKWLLIVWHFDLWLIITL